MLSTNWLKSADYRMVLAWLKKWYRRWLLLTLWGQSRRGLGAASCRPFWSWYLGWRSGRAAGLSYPPLDPEALGNGGT